MAGDGWCLVQAVKCRVFPPDHVAVDGLLAGDTSNVDDVDYLLPSNTSNIGDVDGHLAGNTANTSDASCGNDVFHGRKNKQATS